MKLLFKSAAAETIETTIGQTNFKEHYPSVEGSMKWKELKTTIRQATQSFVIPLVGAAMYNKLADDYNDTTGLESEQSAVVNFLQDAIAHYTIYKALPYMPFIVSSNGIQKAQPTEGAVAPTFGERKDTRWNAHIDADGYLDEALKLLENTEGEYWQPWRDHADKNFKTSVVFKTATELDDHLNIQGSRRAFTTLVPYLRKSEESSIEKILGSELLKSLSLVEMPLNTPINLTEQKLLAELHNRVKKFVAQDGLFIAIPFLTLVIEGDGFKVVSRGDGIEERNGLKHQQHENAILRLRDAARQSAEQYKDDLLTFLWKHKADLPLWLESDYYMSQITVGTSSQVISTGAGSVFLRF